MTAREDEFESLIGDRVHLVCTIAGVRRNRRLQPRGKLLLFPSTTVATQHVDRTIARGGENPRRWISRKSIARPTLEGGDERLADGILGAIEIPESPRQNRDATPGVAPKTRFNLFR